MILASPNVDIRIEPEIAKNCLYFTFKGKFTEEASTVSTEAWARFMDQHPSESFTFVWDCMEMSGFEMNARKKWYENMKSYTGRIEYIHVISKNILIRGAARVMLEFFGIKGQIAKSYDVLKERQLD